MYRLLAIDLDGTLLNSYHRITPRTLDVLRRAMVSGMRVVIATGRVPYSVYTVLGDLAINAPMISSNGATIIDTRTNTIVSQQLVPEQYILSVLAAARDLDLQFCYYTHDYLYAEQVLYTGQNWYLADVPVRAVPDITEVYPQPCIKIGAYGEEETLCGPALCSLQYFTADGFLFIERGIVFLRVGGNTAIDVYDDGHDTSPSLKKGMAGMTDLTLYDKRAANL